MKVQRSIARILVATGVAMAAVALVVQQTSAGRARILEIEQRTSAGTTAQIYWDTGSGFNEANTVRLPLQRTPDGFQTLRFTLPAATIVGIRFDPTDAPGDILIRAIRVLGGGGTTTAVLNPGSLWPMQGIESMTRESVGSRIRTAGTDPFFFVTAGCLAGHGALSLFTVNPFSLMLVSLTVLMLVVACLVPIARDFLSQAQGPTVDVQPRWLAVHWLAALFLVTFAAKLTLIHFFSAPVPYEDQWGAEAGVLYVPFSEGCLSWRQMFSLHNEHRVFFTRLLALALLLVNGEWDPQLQQIVNAGVHAFTAVVLASMFWLALGRRRIDVIALVSGAAFALPFGWENTLGGFHSAFYLLFFFTALALWLTTRFRWGSRPWFLGWICALCALFTSAGGLFTAAALLIPPVLRYVSGRVSRGEILATLGAAGMVIAIGVATMSPPIPYHAVLKAGTPGAFLTSLARNLAWPWVNVPSVFIVMWLPLGAITASVLLRRRAVGLLRQHVYALGGWAGLQGVALAYSRGAGGPVPASRYMDSLSLGFVANAIAVLAILGDLDERPVRKGLGLGAATLWFVFATVGLYSVTREQIVIGAFVRHAWMNAYVENVRHFLSTDDAAVLTSKPFPFQVPMSNPPMLVNAWLRHPYIRSILPSTIREPIRLTPAGTNLAFVANGAYPTTPVDPLRPSRGSFTSQGNATEGRFESAPVKGCEATGRLKLDVAGYVGQAGLSLAIKELDSGRERSIRPWFPAGERWIGLETRCPRGPFTIVAADARADSWFAFRDPVEIGWGSSAAEWLIARSTKLLLSALALTALALRWT